MLQEAILFKKTKTKPGWRRDSKKDNKLVICLFMFVDCNLIPFVMCLGEWTKPYVFGLGSVSSIICLYCYYQSMRGD